jgi:hypothetical protein
LQLELTQLKQINGVKEFAQNITFAINNLNQAIDHTPGMALNDTVRTMNELLGLKTYLANLRTNIGTLVRASRPDTLERATEIAVEKEAIQNTSNPYKNAQYPRTQNPYDRFKQQNHNVTPEQSVLPFKFVLVKPVIVIMQIM